MNVVLAILLSWSTANIAYTSGNYDLAATEYQAIIDSAHTITREYAPVYYNLGNARFRQGELSQSILAYERCLRLDPTNKDARHNLRFAQQRIVDNINDNRIFFLRSWVVGLRNRLTITTWMVLSIGLFSLTLIGLLIFAFARPQRLRKTGFYTAIVAIVVSGIAFANAASLNNRDTQRAEAIVTRGIVNAKASPDRSGTDLFTLHEGTKVIIKETLGDWVNVHAGNYEGWIPANTMERI